MLELHVRSLPLKGVLTDIANSLYTSVESDCEVYEVKIPTEFGSGKITGINFRSGIGYINYDCTFKKPVRIDFTVNSLHPIKFLYILRGDIAHAFEGEKDIHELGLHQSAIVASARNRGHIITFKAGENIQFCSIEIIRKEFLKEMFCDVAKLNISIRELFLDTPISESYYHEGNYSLRLFDLLRDDVNMHPYTGLVQRLHLMRLSSGILHEQLDTYDLEQHTDHRFHVLKRGDVEAVRQAVELIKSRMDRPLNIEELARSIGTNPTKLQKNFRMVYGRSINGFIKKLRLEKASELLISSDKSITDIVRAVGIINRGYFSKMFRDHYGSTPQAYRVKFVKKLKS